MKKKLTVAICCLVLMQACHSPSGKPEIQAGSAKPLAEGAEGPQAAEAPPKSVGRDAVELVASAPEEARKLARSSPESVAVEAAKAAGALAGETVTEGKVRARLKALADLAAYAAEVAPASEIAREAASTAKSYVSDAGH